MPHTKVNIVENTMSHLEYPPIQILAEIILNCEQEFDAGFTKT